MRRTVSNVRYFAVPVTKVNISSAPEKSISLCFLDIPLLNNKWSKGSSVQIKHFTSPILVKDTCFLKLLLELLIKRIRAHRASSKATRLLLTR